MRKPSMATESRKPVPPNIFSTLPRELRDQIYDIVFQSCRYLPVCFPGSHPSTQLLLRYNSASPNSRANYLDPATNHCKWVLACKQIMTEALQQYLRNVHWYWDGVAHVKHVCEMSLMWKMAASDFDWSRITELEISLASWQAQRPRNEVQMDKIRRIGQASRNTVLSRIRIVKNDWTVWDASVRAPLPDFSEKLAVYMDEFPHVHAMVWEYGITNRHFTWDWVLVQWDERSEEMKVLEDHRSGLNYEAFEIND